EQLAGDLLPNPTTEQKIASGYNRLLQTTEEGGAQPKEYTAKYAADRVRNASAVWLGSTMGCCECHDHKFDPFSTKDFYSLAAFFADIREKPVGRGRSTSCRAATGWTSPARSCSPTCPAFCRASTEGTSPSARLAGWTWRGGWSARTTR